ncbi:MAG TPA: redoxin domain-containing protein [Bryobacteraceae bacterium]|nr:redoxin domain-containing protein [Bryobacteraceae bacterium]
MRHKLLILLLIASVGSAALVNDVRSAIAENNFTHAENLIRNYRKQSGTTPEMLEALSWMARAEFARKQLDAAEKHAVETQNLVAEYLKRRPGVDAENHLPIALGAAIEVEAQVTAARGERDQAVTFLRTQLAAYRNTSIATRIQKNIHLLSLEGKPAPALDTGEYLGVKPPTLASLKGKAVLLFLWAHWCGDCKNLVPELARLGNDFSARGLVVIGPTQRYGYAERGRDVVPAEELKYIDAIRRQFYAPLLTMPVPVSQQNFLNYGVSTTPTLVLIDRNGTVAMYHPGHMSYEELSRRVNRVLQAK